MKLMALSLSSYITTGTWSTQFKLNSKIPLTFIQVQVFVVVFLERVLMLFAIFAFLVVTDHANVAHSDLLRFLVFLAKQFTGTTASSGPFRTVFTLELSVKDYYIQMKAYFFILI